MLGKPQIAPLEFKKLERAEKYAVGNYSHFLALADTKLDVCRLDISFRLDQSYHFPVFSELGKMLQKGTKSRSQSDITEYFDRLGAFTEVSVNRDRLVFSAYTLSKNLIRASRLMAEIMEEATFPEDEWAIQKSQTLSRMAINNKKTSYRAQKSFSAHLFPNHFYGQSLEEKELNFMGQAQFSEALHSLRNQPMTITLSGGFDDKDVQEIHNLFAAFGQMKPDRNGIIPPPSRLIIQPDPTEGAQQATIRMGMRCMDRNHEDFFSFSMLIKALGGYFGSRLMKNIREEKGLTYGISGRIVHLEQESYLIIASDVKKEAVEEVIGEIQHEINRLRKEPIGCDELSLLSNYLKGSYLSSISTIFDVMDRNLNLFLHGLPSNYYQKYFESLEETTAGDVQGTALRYLDAENFITIVSS